MAKKYLLYIHDDRFSVEPKKSELVNELLVQHYDIAGNKHGELVPGPTEKVKKEFTKLKRRPCSTHGLESQASHGCGECAMSEVLYERAQRGL